MHLSFGYLFIFNNPTYEKRLLLLVGLSDKTKEDKKIIHLLHREVKLDKFLFFFFFITCSGWCVKISCKNWKLKLQLTGYWTCGCYSYLDVFVWKWNRMDGKLWKENFFECLVERGGRKINDGIHIFSSRAHQNGKKIKWGRIFS